MHIARRSLCASRTLPSSISSAILESQAAACRDYARTKNIRIFKVFVEQGESAKFAGRTRLLELIDFCRERDPALP